MFLLALAVLILGPTLGNSLGVLAAIGLAGYAFFKWRYKYWKRQNVPYLEPLIPFGNAVNPFRRKEYTGVTFRKYYNDIKANGWKHCGIFSMLTPQYLVVDLDYIRNILTKDFQSWTDRGMYVNEKDDPLSAHLFNIEGNKWRNMRTKLSPTFTSGKMKMMFQTLVDCIPNFLGKIEKDRVEKVPIDIKEALGCFTTDIIGSCAFGLDCKSFENENSAFRDNGRRFFVFSKKRMMVALLCSNFPNFAKFLGLSMTPKDIQDFFVKVVQDTVTYREKNNLSRKDFMQLLIDLKNNNLMNEDGQKVGATLNMEELAAQSFVFFIAGFETSSTTMTFAMYELASQPQIQEKLRQEIEEVLGKHEDKITYEAIQEMKYLDKVINETLRKYPPVPLLFRKSVKDYKVPDQDVVIQKGIKAVIPVTGIHYDPEYYPDPEKFDPERFSEENKAKRHNYAYLPFGEGPRNCIGMRFGLMQSKVGLTALIRNYKFSVNEKTIQPIKIKKTSFIPTVEGDVWLDAEKI